MSPGFPLPRDPVERRVLAFVRRKSLLPRGCNVVVAVGGGSSSLGLLGFLLAAREALGIARLAVASVDREGTETSDDAERVADVGRLARQLDLDFHALLPRSGVATSPAGLHRELEGLAADQGFDRIAMGHTREDVVLATLHGAITRGTIEAARAYPSKGPGRIVRPLLTVDAYEAAGLSRLLEAELPGMEAPAAPRGVHAALREVVLPRIRAIVPGADRAIAQLAGELASLRVYLRSEASEVLAAGAAGEGIWNLPRSSVEKSALRRAIAGCLLHGGAEEHGLEERDRDLRRLAAVLGRIGRDRKGLALVAGHRVSWGPGVLGGDGVVRVQLARPMALRPTRG